MVKEIIPCTIIQKEQNKEIQQRINVKIIGITTNNNRSSDQLFTIDVKYTDIDTNIIITPGLVNDKLVELNKGLNLMLSQLKINGLVEWRKLFMISDEYQFI